MLIFQMSSCICPVKFDLESDFELDFGVGLAHWDHPYYAYYNLKVGRALHRQIWINMSLGWGEKVNFSQPGYPGSQLVSLVPATLVYCTNYVT